jgi:photoactive yellow protein
VTTAPLPSFDQPDLARVVEALPVLGLDNLPFGAIRLDAEGEVRVYSGAERRLSGSGDRPRLGLHFFREVAPCMDTPRYRGRIERAMAEGRLDIEFGWTGDFGDAERSLRVRVQSATGGGCWIFMKREGVAE